MFYQAEFAWCDKLRYKHKVWFTHIVKWMRC